MRSILLEKISTLKPDKLDQAAHKGLCGCLQPATQGLRIMSNSNKAKNRAFAPIFTD